MCFTQSTTKPEVLQKSHLAPKNFSTIGLLLNTREYVGPISSNLWRISGMQAGLMMVKKIEDITYATTGHFPYLNTKLYWEGMDLKF